MNLILLNFILLFLFYQNAHSMSEKQMKSTANLLRSVCQPKTKVTDLQIENMHKGIFEDDVKPKCYMKCVLESAQMMKNSKMLVESTLKQINALPERYAGPCKDIAQKCKDSVTDPDPCEAAYQLAQCWWSTDSQYYFFP